MGNTSQRQSNAPARIDATRSIGIDKKARATAGSGLRTSSRNQRPTMRSSAATACIPAQERYLRRTASTFGEPTVPGGSLAPLMDPPLIEIEGLTNRFDALTAVENGSFTVPRPRSRQGGATRNSV